MIEPRPNCFSIARMAASTARVRSAGTARSVVTLSVPLRSALSVPLRLAGRDAGPRDRHAWTVLLGSTEGRTAITPRSVSSHPRLPLGLDQLDGLAAALEE